MANIPQFKFRETPDKGVFTTTQFGVVFADGKVVWAEPLTEKQAVALPKPGSSGVTSPLYYIFDSTSTAPHSMFVTYLRQWIGWQLEMGIDRETVYAAQPRLIKRSVMIGLGDTEYNFFTPIGDPLEELE